MKLSLEQVLELNIGLHAISAGYQRIVRHNGEDRPVPQPFDLHSRTRVLIAFNINKLKPHVKAYTSARNEMVMAISKGTGEIKDDDHAGTAEFSRQDAEAQKAEVEASLSMIRESDLKLDDNKAISGAVLAQLAPIVEWAEQGPPV